MSYSVNNRQQYSDNNRPNAIDEVLRFRTRSTAVAVIDHPEMEDDVAIIVDLNNIKQFFLTSGHFENNFNIVKIMAPAKLL